MIRYLFALTFLAMQISANGRTQSAYFFAVCGYLIASEQHSLDAISRISREKGADIRLSCAQAVEIISNSSEKPDGNGNSAVQKAVSGKINIFFVAYPHGLESFSAERESQNRFLRDFFAALHNRNTRDKWLSTDKFAFFFPEGDVNFHWIRSFPDSGRMVRWFSGSLISAILRFSGSGSLSEAILPLSGIYEMPVSNPDTICLKILVKNVIPGRFQVDRRPDGIVFRIPGSPVDRIICAAGPPEKLQWTLLTGAQITEPAFRKIKSGFASPFYSEIPDSAGHLYIRNVAGMTDSGDVYLHTRKIPYDSGWIQIPAAGGRRGSLVFTGDSEWEIYETDRDAVRSSQIVSSRVPDIPWNSLLALFPAALALISLGKAIEQNNDPTIPGSITDRLNMVLTSNNSVQLHPGIPWRGLLLAGLRDKLSLELTGANLSWKYARLRGQISPEEETKVFEHHGITMSAVLLQTQEGVSCRITLDSAESE